MTEIDDDTTEGDIWRDIRQARKEKKQSNTEQSLALLQRKNIPYRTLDATVRHYRVSEVWDFWPSTGKFRHMRTGESGRGVLQLIKKLNYGK